MLYGTDAVIRLFGQDYLTLNWAQSFDDTDDTSGIGAIDRALVRVNWQRRGTDGLTYSADLTRAGAVFEPGMGFLRRRDYLAGNLSTGYGWRPGVGSALNSYSVSGSGSFNRRNADDSTESGSFGIQGQLQTRAGHSVSADVTRSYEDLDRPFPLSEDAVVPVGSYWFTEASLSYNPPMGALFRPSASVSGGRFYDGTRISFSLSPSWSVSQHLALSGAYQLNHIDFDDRSQSFTSHLTRLRTELTFTTRTSASAFVQYNNVDEAVAVNIRFRYNPTEGTDLYIVWNENVNSNRRAFDPVRPLSQARTILIKYARTFTLGF